MERHVHASGALFFRSTLLDELGVPHAFTTRIGPAGKPFGAGGLGAAPEDELLDLLALPAHCPRPRLAEAQQVHGAVCLEVEDASPTLVGKADALLTADPRRALMIRTADCIPILVARTDGARVAAIHAGWRGIVAGVIERTCKALSSGDYHAAIGPCLGPDHFEVGPEVVAAFERAGLARTILPGPSTRAHIDLRLAAEEQLKKAGVQRIDASTSCTYSQPETLYSYRRDVTHGGAPSTGRLAALIAPRGV